MSRRLHAAMNRVLPASLRRGLRDMATAFIPTMRHLDMWVRLEHLARLGLNPEVIFDIGAAEGAWAQRASQIWPNARIVGFEPNESRVPDLEATKARVPNFSYQRCLLGSAIADVEYVDARDQTSLYDRAATGPKVTAPMLTLDSLLTSKRIPPPSFMKLDVQGYELEILKGGQVALAATQAVLLEVNVYHLSPEMPVVLDVLNYMQANGFFWYDILGLVRRQADDAMGHMDFLFLRRDHPLFCDSWE
jgi:FkbM family methyltransferase